MATLTNKYVFSGHDGICENDQPSWLGNYFFNETNGKDKYLEDLATLWLLHYVKRRMIGDGKERQQAADLEARINKLLSGDTNVDVCTLLSILNKKLNR